MGVRGGAARQGGGGGGMSRGAREIMLELASTGLTPVQTALVVELIAASLTEAPDEVKKRSPGAVRTERWRERHKTSHVTSQTSQTSQVTDVTSHKERSLPIPLSKETIGLSKNDKPIERARETPAEIAPPEAATFATELGWTAARIDTEWDKFRDWHLASGTRRKDVLAAWRNWCRSPYQQEGRPEPTGKGRRSITEWAADYEARSRAQLAEREQEEARWRRSSNTDRAGGQ